MFQLENKICDESEPFYDDNNNGTYDENYVGNQNISECIYESGDLSNDLLINIQDIIILIDLVIDIFENNYVPTAQELQIGDIYEDGQLNVIDIVGLVNIIFEQ
mgnify:CR=1 FL=1